MALAAGLLLAAALHGQAPAQRPASAMDREFGLAMAAEDKGDLDRAQAILEKLNRQQPGLFPVEESLGLLYCGREQYERALPLLKSAAASQARSGAAHANLGAALAKLDRNGEAIAEFERAAQLEPANVATQQSLGLLYLAERKPAQAMKALGKAHELRPADEALTLNYATAAMEAGELNAAGKAVEALTDKETSAQAQALLGQIAEKKSAFEDAVRHLTRAQQLDPSESTFWQLGVEFLRHWTFDGAIPEFEAAVARFPRSERLHMGLGASYFGGAKYDRAVPVFADLLAAAPDNALYAEFLGMSCTALMQQQTRTRCAALVGYAQAHPRDAKAAAYAASTMLDGTASEAQLAEAETLLDRAIAAEPKLTDAHFDLGLLRQLRGQWKESVAPLVEAIRLKPDLAQAHYRLALAYGRTGRKQEGRAEMDLQKKYSRQQAEDLDQRLKQITVFLVDVRK